MSEHVKTGGQIAVGCTMWANGAVVFLPSSGSEQWVSLDWLKKVIDEQMNSFKDTDSDLSSLLCRIELEEKQ